MLKLALDHLVVAASTLPQGVAYIEKLLGVEMSPGGQHVFMGTHNTVLRLGRDCYLEVIAIDPSLRAPPRPRWFGLDDAALQASLAETPRLIHWVARTDDIAVAQSLAPPSIGPIVAASRGTLQWKITIHEDGALPAGGAYPTLIEWPSGLHIAGKIADRGCRLVELIIRSPEAADLARSLNLAERPNVKFIESETVHLSALIETPEGMREIR